MEFLGTDLAEQDKRFRTRAVLFFRSVSRAEHDHTTVPILGQADFESS